ncbi:hypothetical protein DERP_000634 [Dermatophagoides pteronyssinus]|uniref:Uncharacterized protein n=1 Tax=Dermatophagoides pteronyssinus TaxID=6956 RepID=A0ABQ8J0P1_DERPT|nr:hypothetical protein DERP_000634 [Dermatophagoides pteronyssinus]
MEELDNPEKKVVVLDTPLYDNRLLIIAEPQKKKKNIPANPCFRYLKQQMSSIFRSISSKSIAVSNLLHSSLVGSNLGTNNVVVVDFERDFHG